MRIISRLCFVFFGFLCATTSVASELVVKNTMNKYWSAFSASQLSEVSKLIYPTDLEEMKLYIVPVFEKATKSDIPEARQMAGIFFDKSSPESWSSLSPEDVFVRFNRLLTVMSPQMFELIKDTRLTTIDVYFAGVTEATVYYSVEIGGQQASDTERLTLHENTWYLRTKESPRNTALKFQRLFEL